MHPLFCSNLMENYMLTGNPLTDIEVHGTCSSLQMINYNIKMSLGTMAFVEYSYATKHLHSGCQVDCTIETVQYYRDSIQQCKSNKFNI